MTIKEALAYLGCNDLDELNEREEQLLFEIKQKLLRKPFHLKIFNKYKEEAERIQRVLCVLDNTKRENVSHSENYSIDESMPSRFITSYLQVKQHMLLTINSALNFTDLFAKINDYINFQHAWAAKWLGHYSVSYKSQDDKLNPYDDMIWVRIKSWIIEGNRDDWNILFQGDLQESLIAEMERFKNNYQLP